MSLEKALAEDLARAEDDDQVYRQVTATRLHLRDLLWACTDYMLSADLTGGDTNYTTLVGALYDWARRRHAHVAYVSFNFDLLSEATSGGTTIRGPGHVRLSKVT